MEISINEYAKEFGISWATAKKRLNGATGRKERCYKGKYILDPYKIIIDTKLEKFSCKASSIYYFLTNKGYEGSQSTVSKYVRNKKDYFKRTITYRVEHTPALLSEVDWKESMVLLSKNNEPYTVNIFLFVLAYSKYKYIELTIDRTQSTLFSCLVNAFKYCGNKVSEKIGLII